jgi:hypothetical protein
MKRVFAVLAAICMIALAVFIRGQLDDEGSSDSRSSSSSGGTVVCATELAAACFELDRAEPDVDVRVEDATTTQATLSDSAFDLEEPPFDVWLTLQPFPAMVADQRARAFQPAALDDAKGPIARSPMVVVIWNDRRAALETSCPPDTTWPWRCIGDVAGRPWGEVGGQAAWGSVKPSHPVPDTTASGLFALSQATASYFGRTDYASNDFVDPAFRRWFEQLERAIPAFPAPPRTPLDEMLSKGPAVFDLAGSTEAAAGPAVASSRDKDRLSILYPSPATTADVVIAPVADSAQGGRLTRLLESDEFAGMLARTGWRVEGRPLADGLDAVYELPGDSGLPRAGVLEALRALWIETIR